VSVTLDTPLAKIIGDRSQKAFHKAFGYESVGDLLGHYPRRYATRGELTSIAEIPIGEQATLVAEVVSVSTRPMRQKRGSVLEVVITDGTGGVTLTFFNQAWRQKTSARVFGEFLPEKLASIETLASWPTPTMNFLSMWNPAKKLEKTGPKAHPALPGNLHPRQLANC